jgi:hypothetical protein
MRDYINGILIEIYNNKLERGARFSPECEGSEWFRGQGHPVGGMMKHLIGQVTDIP